MKRAQKRFLAYPTIGERDISGTPLLECPGVRVNTNVVLWYSPRVEQSGFEFFCGKFYSGDYGPGVFSSSVGDLMSHPNTEVECLFKGSAYFDGVRHLWTGDTSNDGDEGYANYPNLLETISAYAALAFLERELCWHVRATEKADGIARKYRNALKELADE